MPLENQRMGKELPKKYTQIQEAWGTPKGQAQRNSTPEHQDAKI